MMLVFDRIDEGVSFGQHDGARVRKAFDWDVLERRLGRRQEKGYISDPVGKTKSVALTEHELKKSNRLLGKLFGGASKEPYEA